MAVTFSGTAQYLSSGNAILTAMPFTFACWVKISSLSAISVLMALGDSTNANSSEIFVNTTGTLAVQQRQASSGANATTVATIGTGSWHLVVGVCANATSRTIYLDGGNSVNNATSKTPGSPTNTRIGAQTDANFPTAGTIAFPTIWNVALGATDVTNLWNSGLGVDPRTIQSAAVVSFSPLSGNSPWQDTVTTNFWTTTGSPVNAADPFSLTPATTPPPALAYFPFVYTGPIGDLVSTDTLEEQYQIVK